MHWVAVASDGHRTRGDYAFEVKQALTAGGPRGDFLQIPKSFFDTQCVLAAQTVQFNLPTYTVSKKSTVCRDRQDRATLPFCDFLLPDLPFLVLYQNSYPT